MIKDNVRSEMNFYAITSDYSDADRYEQFATDCNLHKKAFEIGYLVRSLVDKISSKAEPVEIVETASATGLTAYGVMVVLSRARIEHVYTSLDIEQNLLDYAKERGRGNKFVQGDFEDLPFEDDMFDVYIMMGADGYRVTGQFYPEVCRVLKRGGYCVMPQIGPDPRVSLFEIDDAHKSGLKIIRADNYLIAQKA